MNISAQQLLQTLATWTELGALRSLDLALTRFIHQQQPQTPAVLLAIALVSERNGHGHVCLDLQATLRQPELLNGLPVTYTDNDGQAANAGLAGSLSLEQWVSELAASSAVENRLGGQANQPASPADSRPLVLAGTAGQPLLYLRRYWQYEQHIRQAIEQRLARQYTLPVAASRDLLQQLFREQSPTGTDWQKVACLLAARSGFAIITGGPGTGKTTTVVRLLALLQGLHQSQQPDSQLQIHLAAPTGKAAARLSESISGNIDSLPLAGTSGQRIRQAIPREVTTLHRLLGSRPDSRHFRHNAANPLATDLVVVDEASMMDVDMMARLVDALPPHARLILLGDKDQLASVEAGSVLADLCQGADDAHYTADTLAWLQQLGDENLDTGYLDPQGTPLQQATCMLRHSYRFNAHPGIGALAEAANSGQATAAQIGQIISAHPDSLHWLRLGLQDSSGQPELAALDKLAVAGYRGYLQCLNTQQPASDDSDALEQWALAVFAAHNSFQLLTAMRRGIFGVDNINQRVRQALQGQQLLPDSPGSWYHGRPVLVTRNDYSLRLMNGDIGICMQWPGGTLRVAFADGHGGIRWILPSRLQAVESVFAMTVHKSQGSEFTHTALVLPDHSSPVLTKELVYTAITRSKEKFTLLTASDSVLARALQQQVQRASGLV
ncbi:MAG: exodeoxyribonuclease V subunit alpha [Gammaproteobacteria bacterium]|nr:exodeoxyribonuclease V subunit alpha [Gammaproteobacteria bacterium]